MLYHSTFKVIFLWKKYHTHCHLFFFCIYSTDCFSAAKLTMGSRTWRFSTYNNKACHWELNSKDLKNIIRMKFWTLKLNENVYHILQINHVLIKQQAYEKCNKILHIKITSITMSLYSTGYYSMLHTVPWCLDSWFF